MNLLRFTVVDATGAVSFIHDSAVLSSVLEACARGVKTLDEFLVATARRSPRLREYVSCGLAVFDEHNVDGKYDAIHQAIAHFRSDEWPVFRIVDDETREASLSPSGAGVIIFNLVERRIVQIQNSATEILPMSQRVRQLQRAGWRIVP